ncbi:MAG: tRNA (adenosine(37)-N6)-dimethylallyltransferase MiaA [Clostridia bacterium]
MINSDNKVIFIVGATASGKSNFGLILAQALDSSIVSCDSMQIYRQANVGTAKISPEEMQDVDHFMIDIVDVDKSFSVSEYSAQANEIINQLHLDKKIPIVVGGTGLYVDSLLFPMSFGCNNDEELRKKLESDLEEYGAEYMHNLLKEIDPQEAEKVHCNNTKRVIRALEIYYLSGKIKSETKELSKPMNYNTLLVVLNPPRKELYARIDKRVDEMFEKGLVEEVKMIVENSSWDAQAVQAIGYKEFKGYFDGNLTLDEVKNLIKLNSRHYAKRQLSWFRRYSFANWADLDDEKQYEEILSKILKFVQE